MISEIDIVQLNAKNNMRNVGSIDLSTSIILHFRYLYPIIFVIRVVLSVKYFWSDYTRSPTFLAVRYKKKRIYLLIFFTIDISSCPYKKTV